MVRISSGAPALRLALFLDIALPGLNQTRADSIWQTEGRDNQLRVVGEVGMFERDGAAQTPGKVALRFFCQHPVCKQSRGERMWRIAVDADAAKTGEQRSGQSEAVRRRGIAALFGDAGV